MARLSKFNSNLSRDTPIVGKDNVMRLSSLEVKMIFKILDGLPVGFPVDNMASDLVVIFVYLIA